MRIHIFFYLLLLPGFLFSETFRIDVHSESTILMNADTGAILFEKNAHESRYPASITKIATALYALEKNRNFLDSEVVAEQESIGTVREEEKERSNYKGPPYRLIVGGTHIMIKRGEILPLRALFYGMMLESGNDAANVIAQYTSGKIDPFIKELNHYLHQIGCLNTHFMNPSGIHHPDHKTTAYDMAVMTRFAMKDPLFREIVKSTHYTRPKTNKQNEMPMSQHNQLVKRGRRHYYEYALGVKTGFHSHAGYNIVAAAERNGRTLIAVAMGCKNIGEHYEDVIALFNLAFNEPKVKKTLLPKGAQNLFVGIGKKQVATYTQEPVILEFYPSENPKVKAWVSPLTMDLPILRGEKVGVMVFADDGGNVLKTADLFAAEEVQESFVHRTKQFLSQNVRNIRYIVLSVILAFCFIGGFRLIRYGSGNSHN